MAHKRVLIQAPAKPPRIEFDASVMGWYVRFTRAKVARTISEKQSGFVYAIDLDASGDIIGFELLGVKEFSIARLIKNPAVDFSRTDFTRARWAPVAEPEGVEA